MAMQSVRKIKAIIAAASSSRAGINSLFPVAQIQSFRRLSWRSRLDAVIVRRNSAAMLSRNPNRIPRKKQGGKAENEDRKDDTKHKADDDRDRVITFRVAHNIAPLS